MERPKNLSILVSATTRRRYDQTRSNLGQRNALEVQIDDGQECMANIHTHARSHHATKSPRHHSTNQRPIIRAYSVRAKSPSRLVTESPCHRVAKSNQLLFSFCCLLRTYALAAPRKSSWGRPTPSMEDQLNACFARLDILVGRHVLGRDGARAGRQA